MKPAKGGKESTRFAHCGGVICRLPNGTVLLAGGDDGGDHDSGAELFDPKSGTFALLDPSPFPRGASVVALASGRVLLFGGRYQGGKAKGVSAQVLAYDPSARSFSHAGTLRTARSDQAAVLLPDGKVLVVGGFIRGKDADSMDTTADCEVFDPRTGTSEAVAAISEPRALLAAAVMPIGQVMILGGLTGSRDSSLMATTIETFDPWRRTWSIYDRPSYGVFRPALFPMPDGSMFVGGSHVAFDPAKRAEDGVLPLKLICE